MDALTKAQIAERVVEEVGFDQREASEMVAQSFEEIGGAHAGNEPAKRLGFGSFTLRDKGERPGRYPSTGEVFPIAARRVATLRAGQKPRVRTEAYAGPRSRR